LAIGNELRVLPRFQRGKLSGLPRLRRGKVYHAIGVAPARAFGAASNAEVW